METILIKNESENVILHTENNKIWGTIFYSDGRIKNASKDVLKYFDLFKLSNRNTRLPNEGKYQVVLDKETNLKHYFLYGVEDFNMLFQNNGSDATVYISGEGTKLPTKTKIFNLGRNIIMLAAAAFTALVIAHAIVPDSPVFTFIESSIAQVQAKKLTLDDVKEKIYSTNGIPDYLKGFIYNEEFFSYLLPEINKSGYLITRFNEKFTDFKINFDFKPDDVRIQGRYLPSRPNQIDVVRGASKAAIAHEIDHVTQEDFEYTMIVEALAEIEDREFYTPTNEYSKYTFLIKYLMEIIGPGPLKEYRMSGKSKMLEDAIKPYLPEEHYNDLIKCLKYDFILNEGNERTLAIVTEARLSELYQNKFGLSPKDDPIIMATKAGTISRYYFRESRITPEYSYIMVDKGLKNLLDSTHARLSVQKLDGDTLYFDSIEYRDFMSGNYDGVVKIRHMDGKLEDPMLYVERVETDTIYDRFPEDRKMII